MKMGKKIIALNIVALAIGIVTILPLAYFTDSNTTVTGKPWFNVDIPYVYIDLYETGKNDRATWDMAYIEVIINFTVTPEARELKEGTDAQIEFYMFHVYSEQGSIANLSYSVAVSRGIKYVQGEPIRDVGITGGGNNCYYFADGTMFDGNIVLGDNHKCGGGTTCNYIPGEEYLSVGEYIYTGLGASIGDSGDPNEEKTMDALAALRSAHTIYIEVSRVCSVSYQESSQHESSTEVTLVNDDALGHIELTRIDDGFICGEYVNGSLPWPVRAPTSASLILQVRSIDKLKTLPTMNCNQ